MHVTRINMNLFFTFTIISFLNRCLNPFIYASQYEVVRRTRTQLIEFIRRHVIRKPATAARVEPLPAPSYQLSDQQSNRCRPNGVVTAVAAVADQVQ